MFEHLDPDTALLLYAERAAALRAAADQDRLARDLRGATRPAWWRRLRPARADYRRVRTPVPQPR